MNKLHPNPPTMTSAIGFDTGSSAWLRAAEQNMPPTGWLLVLVPDAEIDITLAAHRVRELANALGRHVHFLGLCRDTAREPALRRQLIAVSAMVQDGPLSSGVSVEYGRNWLEIVKSNWQPGDALACIADQRTGLGHKPLGQMLEANLGTPVHVLPGLDRSDRARSNWLPGLAGWAGSIGLILIFFWLQVKITQMPPDWTHSALLYISLFIEVILIWGWNSLFS